MLSAFYLHVHVDFPFICSTYKHLHTHRHSSCFSQRSIFSFKAAVKESVFTGPLSWSQSTNVPSHFRRTSVHPGPKLNRVLKSFHVIHTRCESTELLSLVSAMRHPHGAVCAQVWRGHDNSRSLRGDLRQPSTSPRQKRFLLPAAARGFLDPWDWPSPP